VRPNQPQAPSTLDLRSRTPCAYVTVLHDDNRRASLSHVLVHSRLNEGGKTRADLWQIRQMVLLQRSERYDTRRLNRLGKCGSSHPPFLLA
jgi:hypothetical protein